MISSTILTLIVIPAIYGIVKEFAVRKESSRRQEAGQRASSG